MNRVPHIGRAEADAEVILEALAEGGSLTLLGIKSGNGWRFRLVRDESTFADLLNEEDRQGIEFRGESAWVNSWEEALALLDEHRWYKLYAGLVHPDFKRQVWAAVQSRSLRNSARGPFWRRLVSYFAERKTREERRRANALARRQLSEWRHACLGEPSVSERQITIGFARR
jgi:hypothetical protein